jgi:ribonuclease P protein component
MSAQTFKKSERLCSRSKIKSLFETSNSFAAYPIRLLWKKETTEETAPGVQVLISVPKRNIKKAVKRNRIKRLIRESYRKNKQLLLTQDGKEMLHCSIIFIFTGKEEITYSETETKIIQLLRRLKHDYEQGDQ